MKQKEQRLPIFAERFRELQGSMSNTEFAEHLGMSRQTVGFYLNGDRIPDAVGLLQIADVCHVSVDWLLGRSQVKTTEAEVQQICNTTGLSEAAVFGLSFLHSKELPYTPVIELVNLIAEPAPQLDDFSYYFDRASSVAKIAEKKNEKLYRHDVIQKQMIDQYHEDCYVHIPAEEAFTYYAEEAVRHIEGLARQVVYVKPGLFAGRYKMHYRKMDE